jgi:hypothetical protein
MTDHSELAGLVIEARFQYLHLAQTMLDANLAIAGFTATERSEAEALKRQGWRLALEISGAHAIRWPWISRIVPRLTGSFGQRRNAIT